MGSLTARSLIRKVVEGYRFFEGDDPVIPHVVRYGKNPLAVVVGSNGAGKSVFRRLVGFACKDAGIELIPLSMEARAGGTMGAMGAFVYGSEHWEATGVNSAKLVTTGIATCQKRTKDHVIFWDEPDTGMSDEMAAGAGKMILNFALKKPKHTKAIFVVSHNRYMIRKLVAVRPHYVHLGSFPQVSLEQWATRPVEPADLEETAKASTERFRRITAMAKEK